MDKNDNTIIECGGRTSNFIENRLLLCTSERGGAWDSRAWKEKSSEERLTDLPLYYMRQLQPQTDKVVFGNMS